MYRIHLQNTLKTALVATWKTIDQIFSTVKSSDLKQKETDCIKILIDDAVTAVHLVLIRHIFCSRPDWDHLFHLRFFVFINPSMQMTGLLPYISRSTPSISLPIISLQLACTKVLLSNYQ